MLTKRSLIVGGASIAAATALTGAAQAQAGKLQVVFAGHEL